MDVAQLEGDMLELGLRPVGVEEEQIVVLVLRRAAEEHGAVPRIAVGQMEAQPVAVEFFGSLDVGGKEDDMAHAEGARALVIERPGRVDPPPVGAGVERGRLDGELLPVAPDPEADPDPVGVGGMDRPIRVDLERAVGAELLRQAGKDRAFPSPPRPPRGTRRWG